jgi:hypothetical protein
MWSMGHDKVGTNRLDEIKQILESQKALLSEKYGVKEIGIFGSYVKGRQTKRSDLDLLVSFSKPVTLLQFISIENYLSETIGIKTDLVMKDSLKPRIGRQILKEVYII